MLGTASDDLMVHMRLADLRLRAGDPQGARRHVEGMRRSRSPGELESMRDVMVEATEAAIALGEQDPQAVRGARERLLAALQGAVTPSPFQAHASAIGYGTLAALDLAVGERDAAARHVRHGYRHAVDTIDLPILASVGLAAAAVALDAGLPLVAAEMTGAAARLRGADDAGNPAVRRVVEAGQRQVGAPAWDAAYRRGRAMSRAEAVARLDPDLAGPPDASGVRGGSAT